MKRKSLMLFLSAILLVTLFIPGCKTAAAWSPLGTWIVNLSMPAHGHNWSDNFTFTGTDSNGTVVGLTAVGLTGSQTGTWTKTGDYAISMSWDFYYGSYHEIVVLTGTSPEGSPNAINGGGTWTEDSSSAGVTWSAAKI